MVNDDEVDADDYGGEEGGVDDSDNYDSDKVMVMVV